VIPKTGNRYRDLFEASQILSRGRKEKKKKKKRKEITKLHDNFLKSARVHDAAS